MLLGKRPRPPIRRTTSMTGITVDPTDSSDSRNPVLIISIGTEDKSPPPPPVNPQNNSVFDQRLLSMLSPRNHKGGSANSAETPHFLRSCGLCKSRLAPGCDIYMYKGDTAFCSLECREQRMKQDARKEKMGITDEAAKTEDLPQSKSKSNSSSKASSTKSRTGAAA